MRVELHSFQKRALDELRLKTTEAVSRYQHSHANQVISFTAPTGAGKTIIMASLIESIFFGDENHADEQNSIFVWLSDSPQLNEQSKDKIDRKADKIRLGRCVTVTDDSFDQEMFDDGNIYFLNTQKLGKSSNLVQHSDTRQYTIWETLQNTAKEKNDRLYIIIDEAHRGMQGREAGRATTIMQKFLKGSPEDGLDAMPVVIGMSATADRFNKLVSGIASDLQFVVVPIEDVRSSGLLKDRIIISYPEEGAGSKDMAVLQAAADEWRNKWDHWYQYCQEQHYAYVNPVLVIQVQNATGSSISGTDLGECIQKIEDRARVKFTEGEVVHTFGDVSSEIMIGNLKVPYIAASDIAENKQIRVVFFKESLSTGWDCPRAETMMSFRRATDATYIAQLLGRMIRTPLQMHINVDEYLNDVHLYLPYFNAETVDQVVAEFKNAEGGDIPADIFGESIESQVTQTLTVRPKTKRNTSGNHDKQFPGQTSIFDQPTMETSDNAGNNADQLHSGGSRPYNLDTNTPEIHEPNAADFYGKPQGEQANTNPASVVQNDPHVATGVSSGDMTKSSNAVPGHNSITVQGDMPQAEKEPAPADGGVEIDREGIVRAVNDAGLLTYDVRVARINNYLNSLYALCRLLVQSGKYKDATDDVLEEIIKQIREYIGDLKRAGEYEKLTRQVMEFEMKTEIYDVFGESVDNHIVHHFMSTTDVDIDRQFRKAEARLGNEGAALRYGRYYYDEDDPNACKIDVILFANNDDCYNRLLAYAEKTFHNMNDDYRRKIVGLDEKFIKKYNDIISNGDIVSKHNFRLPETINVMREPDGKVYDDHLFADDDGHARIKLNGWEDAVLEEERARGDYVCWLRNPPRKPWSLCIPYETGSGQRSTYPDFVVIRRDSDGEYVVDILEPHDQTRVDNLGKAKAFASYAKQNPGLGRIQLIRKVKDAAGKDRFKRLDMAKSAVCDKVMKVMSDDELNHIFDTDGFFA